MFLILLLSVILPSLLEELNIYNMFYGKALFPSISVLIVGCMAHSESRCALIKGVGSDVHERLYMPEPI
jgi:hypothetical protein